MPSMLLILPSDTTYRSRGAFRRTYSYAPLTLTTLAALVPPEYHYQIDLLDEGVELASHLSDHYDIVAITCVTSSAFRAYELCSLWKKKGAHTVLGGAHPTLMTDEALLHADTVIPGAAEVAWPTFLHDHQTGNPKKLYQCTSEGAGILPIPRRDLIKPGRYLAVPTVIARPGCSNHCAFCSIPHLRGNDDHKRPVREVVNEIEQLGHRRILFLDPNITGDRPYALELFRALRGSQIEWGGLASIDAAADEELVNAMSESGCLGLLIGFESLLQENLVSIGKVFARTREYKEAICILHQAEIAILGCFVLGFDHDTVNTLANLPALVDELEIDLPRYSILTPFPGTPLYRSLEVQGRILTKDWSRYDTEQVVFQPVQMSVGELQSALREAWSGSYRISRITRRVLRLERHRFFGIAANFGLRHYGKRLHSLRRQTDGTLDSDQF